LTWIHTEIVYPPDLAGVTYGKKGENATCEMVWKRDECEGDSETDHDWADEMGK